MPMLGNGCFVADSCVSSGTLRSPDLLRAFADAYEAILPTNGRRLADEARECADALDKWDDSEFLAAEAGDLIETLANEINYVLSQHRAGAGWYFGAHEGDGACFGFWRADDEGEDDGDCDRLD